MKRNILFFVSICLCFGLFSEEIGRCNITEETKKAFNEEDLKLKRALFLYDLYPEADFDKCLEFAEGNKFFKIIKQLEEKGYKIDSSLKISYVN